MTVFSFVTQEGELCATTIVPMTMVRWRIINFKGKQIGLNNLVLDDHSFALFVTNYAHKHIAQDTNF